MIKVTEWRQCCNSLLTGNKIDTRFWNKSEILSANHISFLFQSLKYILTGICFRQKLLFLKFVEIDLEQEYVQLQ